MSSEDLGSNYTGPASDLNGKQLIRQAQKCFTNPERYNAERTWYLMAEFILPSQNSQFFRNPVKGIRNDRRKFDDTAVQACRDLSATMHSTITSSSMNWSKLGFKDPKQNKLPGASDWLLGTSDLIHTTLGASNFDSQMGRCYPAYAGLGTMILFHDEVYDKGRFCGWNFQAWHLAEVAFAENHLGIIDTCYRRFKMSVKAIYDKFGDETVFDESFMSKLHADPQEDMDIWQCIYPRKEEETHLNEFGLGDPKERPYASVYILQKGALILKEEGYYEFPVYVARWSVLPGETYGYGPGNVCLSDVRSANKIMEEVLKAMVKVVNPPIFTTKQNIMSGDLRPGGVVYVRDINQLKEFETQTNFNVVAQEIQRLQTSIKGAFYIDKLLLPPRTETGEMTAYEVQQRLEQMQRILGPVLSRLDSEFLTPFIMRCLKSLNRAKKLQPLPPAVYVKTPKSKSKNPIIDWDIMFVNALARSQELGELQNVEAWLNPIMQMAQIPAAAQGLDKINFDKVIEYAAKIRNIPADLMNSDADVKKIRDQRDQMMAAQAQANLGQQGADSAKSLGQAHQATQQGNAAQSQSNGGKTG